MLLNHEATIIKRSSCGWFQLFEDGDFHSDGKKMVFRKCRIGNVRPGSCKTPQRHGNESVAQKLSVVRVETERCQTVFVYFWAITWNSNRTKFQNRIVTSGENCVDYDNPKSINVPDLPQITDNLNINCFKVCSIFGRNNYANSISRE